MRVVHFWAWVTVPPSGRLGSYLLGNTCTSFVVHDKGLWMSDIKLHVSKDVFPLFLFRWTTSWSPGPAPLGRITLPRSSGNWAAGPASVSRKRRRPASRRREAAQPPVCLHVCAQTDAETRPDSLIHRHSRLNRSGGSQESQVRGDESDGLETDWEDVSVVGSLHERRESTSKNKPVILSAGQRKRLPGQRLGCQVTIYSCSFTASEFKLHPSGWICIASTSWLCPTNQPTNKSKLHAKSLLPPSLRDLTQHHEKKSSHF